MMNAAVRRILAVCALVGVTACDAVFRATPADRIGYLRELVRARTVSRDTLPIDGCSVNRFMDGVPAWRDSLSAEERAVMMDAVPCPRETIPVAGRFVLTSWYRNWSGEYIIRGATTPWEQSYRFTDGIFVGREDTHSAQVFVGIPKPATLPESLRLNDTTGALTGDTVRSAGTVADTVLTQPATKRSPAPPTVR
jgi:hypothetical protein